MGKQSNIKLRCTVENIIYYQWKGIDCIRTVPAHVKQTKPTKKAATDFGKAVKSSAIIRSLFRPLLPEPANRSIIYKMDGAFRKWLKANPLDNTEVVNEITWFDGLSFNDSCDLQKVLKIKITINRTADGGLLLQWPPFNPVTDIKAPTGTRQLDVQCIITTLPMEQPEQAQCVETNFSIPYTDEIFPVQEVELPNVTRPHCLVLVGMAIRYFKDDMQNKPVNILRWKPVGIVGSFYN